MTDSPEQDFQNLLERQEDQEAQDDSEPIKMMSQEQIDAHTSKLIAIRANKNK